MKHMFLRNACRCLLTKLRLIPKPTYILRLDRRQPNAAQLSSREIVAVMGAAEPKWVCLLCPCGSGEVVRLALRPHYGPTWSLQVDLVGRPTLNPSIWQREGCLCHFWIRKGEISFHMA